MAIQDTLAQLAAVNFPAPWGGVLGALGPERGRPKGLGIYPP